MIEAVEAAKNFRRSEFAVRSEEGKRKVGWSPFVRTKVRALRRSVFGGDRQCDKARGNRGGAVLLCLSVGRRLNDRTIL